MNPDPAHNRHPGVGRIPDELIEALLDGHLDEQTGREVARAARRHPLQRTELHSGQRAVEALREPIETPDLTGSILDAADRRRRFLPNRLRRMVSAGRYGAGIALLIVLVGVVAAQRRWPDQTRLSKPQRHVSQVSQAVENDAVQSFELVRKGPRLVRASIISMPPAPSFAGQLTQDWRPEIGSAMLAGGYSAIVVLPGGEIAPAGRQEGPVRWVSSSSATIIGVAMHTSTRDAGTTRDEPRRSNDDPGTLP